MTPTAMVGAAMVGTLACVGSLAAVVAICVLVGSVPLAAVLAVAAMAVFFFGVVLLGQASDAATAMEAAGRQPWPAEENVR